MGWQYHYYLFVIIYVSIKFWEDRIVAFITAMEVYVWKIIYFYRLRADKADAYLLILRQLGVHYVAFRPITFSTVKIFTTAIIKICNIYIARTRIYAATGFCSQPADWAAHIKRMCRQVHWYLNELYWGYLLMCWKCMPSLL